METLTCKSEELNGTNEVKEELRQCTMCKTIKSIECFPLKMNQQSRFRVCDKCREYAIKYKRNILTNARVTCDCGFVATSKKKLASHQVTREHFITLTMKETLKWSEDNPIDNILREKGFTPFLNHQTIKPFKEMEIALHKSL